MAKSKKVKHQSSSHRHPKNVAASTAQPRVGADQSQWSEWTQHSSGLHYYRARYLSTDVAASITLNARSSLVPDGQGHFIHYEFWGVNDAHSSYYTAAPTQTPAAPINTSTDAHASIPTQQEIPVPDIEESDSDSSEDDEEELDEETGEEPVFDDGEAFPSEPAANFDVHQVSILDDHEAPGGMPVRTRQGSGKHSLVLNKKTRKRLQQEKNARINPKAKVYTWLRS